MTKILTIIGIGLACLGIAVPILDLPIWVGVVALVGFFGCIGWAGFLLVREWPGAAIWLWGWSAPSVTWPVGRLVPLEGVAQRWADTAPEHVRRWSEKISSIKDPREYFVYYMLTNTEYPLYGIKPWSTKWFPISDSERRQGMPNDGALVELTSRETIYTRLAMRARDYRKVKSGLKAEIDSFQKLSRS